MAAQVLRHHSVGVTIGVAGAGGPGGMAQVGIGVAGGRA
jgi:hypothetical protein